MSAMAPTLTATEPAAVLAERLREPVWNALSDRADAIRRALPPRPEDPSGHYAWLRSLTAAQACRAALLNHLNGLCEHLAGRPALGYDPDDAMPLAALEEADGFTSEHTALLIAEYRRLRSAGRT